MAEEALGIRLQLDTVYFSKRFFFTRRFHGPLANNEPQLQHDDETGRRGVQCTMMLQLEL